MKKLCLIFFGLTCFLSSCLTLEEAWEIVKLKYPDAYNGCSKYSDPDTACPSNLSVFMFKIQNYNTVSGKCEHRKIEVYRQNDPLAESAIITDELSYTEALRNCDKGE